MLGRGTVAMRVESAPTQHLVTWRRLPWDPSNTWYRIDRAPVTGDDCASIPHEAWEEIAQSPTQSTGVRATGINPGRRYCYAVTAGSRHDLSKPVAHVEPSWVGPSSNTGGLIFQTCDPGQHCPHLQYITRVVPGDLNGDGVMDLVALASKTKQTGDFHVIAFVSGDGGWTRTEAASTRFGPDGTKNNRNSKLRRWMPLAVRDMDGDGRAEIFTRGRKAHGDGSVLLRMYRLEERTGSSRLTPADDAGDVTWPTHVDPRSVFVVADLEDTTGDGTTDDSAGMDTSATATAGSAGTADGGSGATTIDITISASNVDADGSTGDDAAQDDAGGCGCRSADSPSDRPLWPMGLLLLVSSTRSRRRARAVTRN